jgi:Fe-S-cluster containining protein
VNARADVRFECTGCGRCCVGDPRHYWIEATRAEQRRIRRFLGVSQDWFRRRYVVREDDGAEGLSMAGGRCAFLDKNNRCRIYAVRPRQCRTYPFWPELVARDTVWRLEARHCDGIGRGATRPLAQIRKRLAK